MNCFSMPAGEKKRQNAATMLHNFVKAMAKPYPRSSKGGKYPAAHMEKAYCNAQHTCVGRNIKKQNIRIKTINPNTRF